MLISLAEHMKPVRALTRPHKGIVVDNQDPERLGRVRVEIAGLLEGNKEDLPWVNSVQNPDSPRVPKLEDELYIIFPYNSIYFPFFLGHWHSEITHNDEFDDDYPNTFGTEAEGFILRYNTIKEVADLEHPSGTKGMIIKDGSLTFEIEKDLILTLKGDVKIENDGLLSFTSKAGIEFSTEGMAQFEGDRGTTIGSSGSVTMVNGTTVLLGGGGLPVAIVTSQSIGTGNLGAPVLSTIIQGSSKVFAAP